MQLRNVEDVYALSPMQEGMLFHTISEPRSGVFVEQICGKLVGALDVPRFHAAWDGVVQRHAALRTAFLWDGLDEPLQIVREKVDLPWSFHDWRDCSNQERRRKYAAFLHADRQRGLDLSAAPLMRLTLLQESRECHRFVWTLHHLVADGWSTSLLLDEVFTSYAASIHGETLACREPFAFREYIAWLQAGNMQEAEAFWRDRLQGFTTPTTITDRMTSVATAPREEKAYKRHHIALSEHLSHQLRAFAQHHRLTVNTMILGAWALLLSTYSGEADVVLGATASGRSPDVAGVEAAIGNFINTLPLRAQINDQALVPWLHEIQRQQMATRDFEYTPLVSIQQWSDIPPGDSLFSHIVVFENYPESTENALADAAVSLEELDYYEQSNYPLALLVVPRSTISFYLVHDCAQYADRFAKQLAMHLRQLLESFIAHPKGLLSEHNLITDDERRLVLRDWNRTEVDLDTDRTLHSLIQNQVRRQPAATAVVSEGNSLTYEELDRQAECISNQLTAVGVKPNGNVGLLTDRSLEMVIGILGILKAGAAYVPLDPSYPASHREHVVSDAEVEAIVTTRSLENLLPHADRAVVFADEQSSFREPVPAHSCHADDRAYLIYTSGSEGRPKGVPVTHKNIVSSTLARQHFYQGSPGRFLLLSSFSFDSAMVGIFWTLVSGGTLVLPAPQLEQDIESLSRLIAEQQVTHTLCLPSLYAVLLQHAPPSDLASLRTVIVAGEACTDAVLRNHLATLPHTRLFNEYGPTETTVWCCGCELTQETLEGPIPIGRPIANTQLYVLDRHHRPVPPGVCGELYVASDGVTDGYWNQPALTAERFVPNPFATKGQATMYRTGDLAYWLPNGALVFAGRIDNQVKIRGYRIELDEIENTLRQHPAVQDAVVTTQSFETDQGLLDVDEILERLSALGTAKSLQLLRDVTAIPEPDLDGLIAEDVA